MAFATLAKEKELLVVPMTIAAVLLGASTAYAQPVRPKAVRVQTTPFAAAPWYVTMENVYLSLLGVIQIVIVPAA
jgi:hypothetical protein